MPRVPLVHLVTATAVTMAVVAGGVLAAGPGDLVLADPVQISRDPVVSRGAQASVVTGGMSALRRVTDEDTATYRVAEAPEPIQAAPEPDPSPEAVTGTVITPAPPLPPSSTFRIGTFNVLGSQHTRGSSRWAAGTTRAGWTADLIRSHGVTIVGLQEVQKDQLDVLRNRLSGYQIWPGDALGNNGRRLQIAFRRDLFELVGQHSFNTPFHRQVRPIPVVRLRHRATGSEFHVMTMHNSPLGMQAERDRARGAQIAHINRLRQETGIPMFVVGDANEKERWFCHVGGSTGMVAANGGSTAGGCRMPPPPVKIDWIMGRGVAFSGYSHIAGGLAARASDHDFYYATATVNPR
ncbi:endonuclease/exonuclease/phosphatase family protein [Nocardioides limicola]|uniref:endonuclease/exonuclease/phosphatase family protein n=1 Tax=Nocardioides limicola TaxID=2803368 RepID=UPI00193BA94B|nr:endonuclease/exonuclease/phosphatase family protein [Nocardioides sp. DJM-14]